MTKKHSLPLIIGAAMALTGCGGGSSSAPHPLSYAATSVPSNYWAQGITNDGSTLVNNFADDSVGIMKLDGSVTLIAPANSSYTPQAMSRNGAFVIAYSEDLYGNQNGWLYDVKGKKWIDLGHNMYPEAVNDLGDVVAGDALGEVVIRHHNGSSDTVITDTSRAYIIFSLNDSDQFVGVSEPASGPTMGFAALKARIATWTQLSPHAILKSFLAHMALKPHGG